MKFNFPVFIYRPGSTAELLKFCDKLVVILDLIAIYQNLTYIVRIRLYNSTAMTSTKLINCINCSIAMPKYCITRCWLITLQNAGHHHPATVQVKDIWLSVHLHLQFEKLKTWWLFLLTVPSGRGTFLVFCFETEAAPITQLTNSLAQA